MRFLHTGDIHWGRVPDKEFEWSGKRAEEVREALEKMVDECAKDRTDLMLICGDMLDKAPTLRDLKSIASLFRKIPDTRIVICAGNHDYICANSYYSEFEWPGNVTFLGEETVSSVHFAKLNVTVYGMSYRHRQIRERIFDEVKPQDLSAINILMVHGGLEDSIPFDKKKLLGAGFDYIACGHIHLPQQLDERMWYCGSPEPLDKNENGIHGFIKGELTDTKEICTRFCRCAAREYIRLDIEITPETTQQLLKAELKDRIGVAGDENIYIVKLHGHRDRDIRFDRDELMRLGKIVELADDTKPDYDFDRMQLENRDNIIGMFIDTIRKDGRGEVAEKALYYGISALLGED